MKKLYFTCLLFLFSGAAFGQQGAQEAPPKNLQELSWMEGVWKGMAGNAAFFEGYTLVNDTLIDIHYYADASLNQVTGRGTIYLANNSIYHTYGKSKWKLAQAKPNRWAFVPVENAANRFEWIFIGPNAWKAALTNAGKTEEYLLERIH